MTTRDAEQSKYERIWDRPGYRQRSPAMRVLDKALAALKPAPGATVADWGCGTGRATLALQERGLVATGIDIAANALETPVPFREACLWSMPEDMPVFDYGICCDVMEHIPPAHVAEVLRQIHAHTGKAVFFQIALFKEHFGDQIGETLHLSVFPAKRWGKLLRAAFREVEGKADKNYVLALCRV